MFLGAGCQSEPQAEIQSPVLGKADALVTIEEYFDFQCPACKSAYESVLPFVIEDYINAGKAKLVYKNLAFLGPESRDAAEAALCANDQGKFKQYHDKLYDNQGDENRGAFRKDSLKKFASEVGLDAAAFNSCFDGGKYEGQIRKELSLGYAAGVNSTPTYIINGQKVLGGSYISIKRVIDKKLEEAKK